MPVITEPTPPLLTVSTIHAVTFTVDGVKRSARIEQCQHSAYVACWGGGRDDDCTVHSPDALLVMVAVARGDTVPGVTAECARVLRLAATVFALGDRVTGPVWGARDSV